MWFKEGKVHREGDQEWWK